MVIRDGGPSSGYVSTGFFGGKYLTMPLFPCVEFIFIFIFIRSYFGSCHFSRGD